MGHEYQNFYDIRHPTNHRQWNLDDEHLIVPTTFIPGGELGNGANHQWESSFRANPDYEDASFSRPNGSIGPNTNFFRKSNNILLIYLFPSFIDPLDNSSFIKISPCAKVKTREDFR